MDIATQLLNLYWTVRIEFYARRIARCIIPELQQAVLRKFGDKAYHGTEVKAYLASRAAQMSQPLVDDLLRFNPRIPSLLGNKLVISAAAKAAAIVSKTDRRRLVAA
jgi:hypothetical protein